MSDETTVHRFAGALQDLEKSGDAAMMTDLFASGAELTRPEAGKPGSTTDDVAAYWDTYLAQFDEIGTEFDQMRESDDMAWLEWHSNGTLATGRKIEYAGVSLLELDEDGLVRRFATYYDTAAFLAPEA
jgi:hypothetical protein